MTALAHSIGRRTTAASSLAWDVILVIGGSLVVAGLAQVSISLLPFSPVPITGQTLAVLLVGASLGAVRGASSLALYLLWGAIGLPFFAEGRSGTELLAASSPTGGYLFGFVIAAAVVGWLAQRGWDRSLRSSLGAMLIGEIIIFALGVPWLAAAFDLPGQVALEQGLYPFVIGDVIKLVLAAGLLPAAWRLAGKRDA